MAKSICESRIKAYIKSKQRMYELKLNNLRAEQCEEWSRTFKTMLACVNGIGQVKISPNHHDLPYNNSNDGGDTRLYICIALEKTTDIEETIKNLKNCCAEYSKMKNELDRWELDTISHGKNEFEVYEVPDPIIIEGDCDCSPD